MSTLLENPRLVLGAQYCSCVVCHIDACSGVFSQLLAVISSSRATFVNFETTYVSHVTPETEISLVDFA